MAGHDDRIGDYLTALEIELRELGRPHPVDTLFIGGGTPTHLHVADLRKLLQLLEIWFPVSEGGEYSCEANPRDICSETLQALVDHGVNRLSLGVQSFHTQHLATLERDHDGTVVADAVKLASQCIGNLSLDLIFGVPGQTVEQWQLDLDAAFALPISHLSTYGLTFEKGTRFWNQKQRGAMVAVEEDEELEMYQVARAQASRSGWDHYEISNYSRPGFACRHNVAYWKGLGWFAVGPGAARFVNGRREVNHRSPIAYVRRLLKNDSATIESEAITMETWARERLAFGLRMLRGVDLDEIFQDTGIRLQALCEKEFSQLSDMGMIHYESDSVRLTERGLVVSDSVLSRLL